MCSRNVPVVDRESALWAGFSRRAIVAACTAAVAFGCGRPPPAPVDDPLPKGQVVLTDVVLDRFEADRLSHRAFVKRMQLDRANRVVEGTDIEVEALGAPGDAEPVRARLQAPRGTMTLKQRVTRLEGGVTVTDHAGRILRSETLTYLEAEDRLSTRDPVSVRGSNFHLKGQGLNAHLGRDELQLGGPVTATFDGAAGQPAPP